MDKHNELIFLACTPEQEKATNEKIDENCVILEEYLQKVADIKTAEIDTFHQMEMEINHPDIPSDASDSRSVSTEGDDQTQNMAIFRPQSDMKPKLLQRGCTLKKISTFLTSFENYMSHGYQNKIPN